MDGAGFFPAGRGKGQNLRVGAGRLTRRGEGQNLRGGAGAKLEYIS